MKVIVLFVLALTWPAAGAEVAADRAAREGKVAAKPLFRDPVHDDAADLSFLHQGITFTVAAKRGPSASSPTTCCRASSPAQSGRRWRGA